MTLAQKIYRIYPELLNFSWYFYTGVITLQDDSDGRGQYIRSWNYDQPQPTQEQLDLINE